MENRLIIQETLNGCGVACVASLLGKSYKEALKLFNKKKVLERGCLCREIVRALKKADKCYSYGKATKHTKRYLRITGSIVFIRRSKKYPTGHYLLKTRKGWMNSWVNTPYLNPSKAEFQKKLPGEAQWIIFDSKL